MRRFSSGVVSSERSTSSRRDLTTITAAGTRCLWRRMNFTSGQSSTFAPRPRERPKRASRIAPVSTARARRSDRRQIGWHRRIRSRHSARRMLPCAASRSTALGTEISRSGCCKPSRRLVSKSSTCGVAFGVIEICNSPPKIGRERGECSCFHHILTRGYSPGQRLEWLVESEAWIDAGIRYRSGYSSLPGHAKVYFVMRRYGKSPKAE